MTATASLIDLQKKQKQHDLHFHADIYYLSYPDRMRHFVFHFAKYTGRLAAPLDQTGKNSWKTLLSDTTIVSLAAAEVLDLDLDKVLAAKAPATSLAERMQKLDTYPSMSDAELQDWWLRRSAKATGQMAKALESLDHMEAFDSRAALTQGVLEHLESALVVAKRRQIDIPALLTERWIEIEQKRVL